MDKFFVNPGSATGAVLNGWGEDKEEPTPSFCLMDVSTDDTEGGVKASTPVGRSDDANSTLSRLFRSKESLSLSMCTSYGRMIRATKTWRWRRLHIQNRSNLREELLHDRCGVKTTELFLREKDVDGRLLLSKVVDTQIRCTAELPNSPSKMCQHHLLKLSKMDAYATLFS